MVYLINLSSTFSLHIISLLYTNVHLAADLLKRGDKCSQKCIWTREKVVKINPSELSEKTIIPKILKKKQSSSKKNNMHCCFQELMFYAIEKSHIWKVKKNTFFHLILVNSFPNSFIVLKTYVFFEKIYLSFVLSLT